MTQEAWRPSEQPVHFRAVIAPDQHDQCKDDMRVVGFRKYSSCESWVAEQETFKGWRYTIEPLFTAAQLAAEVQRAVAAETERCAMVAKTCDVGACPNVPKQRQMIAAAIMKAQP
jgi:hypothetical protein